MASFSRAAFSFCPPRHSVFAPPSLFTKHAASRFFSTSLARTRPPAKAPSPIYKKKAKSTAKTTVKTTTTIAPARAPSVAPSKYAFLKSLTSKQSPTVLYEAPSHFWFYFGCWSSGIAILGWTALTGPAVIQQPEEIPPWVSVVYGASYVLLGAMGFFIISKTPNVVGAIRVLPVARGPQLQVTVRRMVPLLKPKVITTSLDNVSLKSRFSLPQEHVPELKRLEKQRLEEEQRRALQKFDMQHLLTMPFRRAGRTLASMFRGVRSAWTDMGFGAIKVDGKFYKVDVTNGFAHDGFKSLEQIVQVGLK